MSDQPEMLALEDELRRSHERFRNLFDGLPIGLYLSTPTGKIIDVNPAAVEMLGYGSSDALLAVNAFDLYANPADRLRWQTELDDEGVVLDFEERLRRADGSEIWMRENSRAVRDEVGRVLYYQGSLIDITDSKRAQEQLQGQEERYRTIVEHSNDMIWTLDTEARFTFFNALSEKISGYRLADWRGKSFAPVIPPDDLPRITEIFCRTLAGEPQQYEVGVRREDGSVFHLSVNSAPLYEGGKITGTVSFGRDITEQKRTTQALAESERRYREQAEDLSMLCETARLITSSVVEKQILDQISARCAEALHVDVVLVRLIEDGHLVVRGSFYRTAAEGDLVERLLREHRLTVGRGIAGLVALTGKPIASGDAPLESLTLPGYVDYLRDRSWLVVPLKIEERVIGVLTFISGGQRRAFRPREVALAEGVANQAAMAIHIARLLDSLRQEVEERRRAESALRETRNYVENLIEYANAPTVVWDPQFRITRFNRAFECATGHLATDVIGRHVQLLFSDRSVEELSRIARKSAGEQGESVELPILRKDAEICDVLWSSANIHGDDGTTVVATIAQGTDITERKRLEEELRRVQKLEAMGRLAGGVAHDFNNLLQVLLSTIDAVHSARRDAQAIDGCLSELRTNIERGAALTRQLLLFARREAVRPERVDLHHLVLHASTMLRRLTRESIALRVEPGADPLWCDVDRGQVEQILMNLAVNAADAMPNAGEIAVRTGAQGDEVWFEVQDTGVGMSEELQARIFEPFFTTKGASQGTGLGLAVVHGIVTQHGGRIEVSSRPGEGSIFRVILPRRAAATAGVATATASAAEVPAGHGERVLVVEDEPGTREGLTQILAALGYAATSVASAEEAERLPADTPFDVLLSDVLLPGAPGMEVARRLLGRWPELRVILMSGYPAEDVAKCVREGVPARFLPKPFDMATLARELRAALASLSPDYAA